MADDMFDGKPQCAFYARNPYPSSGHLAQHFAAAEVTVIVACVAPDGGFSGYGVAVEVCASHGEELERDYGAVRVPRPVAAEAA